jgi:hypothetical protein
MKKVKTKIVIVLSLTIFIMSLLLFISYLLLPSLLERYIIPEFAPGFGVSNLTLSVDRADISGLTVSSLNISNQRQSGVKVKRFSVDLDGQTMKALKIEGVKLFAELNNGRLKIPGIKISGGDESQIETKGGGLFTIPSFISRNCLVSIKDSELYLKLIRNGKEDDIVLPLQMKFKRSGGKIEFKISSKNIKVHYSDINASVPVFEFTGTLNYNSGKGNAQKKLPAVKPFYEVSGTLKIIRFSMKQNNFSVQNFTARVPFKMQLRESGITWQTPDNLKVKGVARIEEIITKNDKIEDLKFQILQKSGSFIIQSSYSDLIENRPIKFKLAVTPPARRHPLSVSLESYFNEKNLDIQLNSLRGVSTSGRFTGDINFHSKITYMVVSQDIKKNLTGSAALNIENGNFEDPEQELSVKGIKLSFTLEDVFKLKSKPSQEFSFKECSIQNFHINDALFRFQTESPDSYFIERVGFKWCSGNVAVNAFRIRASHPKDIDMILYCDRLNVTELLNQFQIGHASGNGTVSGKIPIMYNKRKLLIDNGFLYSTPGLGGHIALTDFLGPLTDMKSLFQIDIAQEALKNFNYNWLRIKLNSEKEELLLRLEMDGAPVGLLPFGFDFDRGGFYRSENSNIKAKFNGISFQINFRLPADRVLEYGRKFQELKK